MVSQLFPLCLPYYISKPSSSHLVTATFTDESDLTRYILTLENGKCSSITHIATATGHTIDTRLKYVASKDPNFPLLLSIPASHSKCKLEIDVSGLSASDEQKSLVILKSFGERPLPNKIQDLLQDKSENSGWDLSRIDYKKILTGNDSVIVNDSFSKKSTTENVLTISLWESSSSSDSLLFSFKIWVDDSVLSSTYSTPILAKAGRFEDAAPGSEGLEELNVAALRKAFNFNLHDGPEFRKALAAYENDIPKLKKTMMGLQDDVRGLDNNFKRLLVSRNRVLDSLSAIFDLQFNPVLKKLNVLPTFSSSFKQLFDVLEKNLSFVMREVLNFSSFPKMISFCMSSTTSDGGYEPAATKKAFEKSSKEYYDWLHRYLSNEKDRPESKLLLKRKTFELSKFDYLNSLNSASNNQYFNQFLENLMKFANLSTNNGLLDFKSFRDNKETLLDASEVLYLNGLSRFNSEKLQLHQMIEACRSNEELTKLLKENSLNSSQSTPRGDKKKVPLLDTSVNNLDLVFPNSPISNSPNTAPSKDSSWEADQNPDLSGILYALGGQGKPGWHKEWVVLKKGKLVEYSDWRNGTSPINKPIDVALASVKPITKDRRQYCLEIITSQGSKHIFQAINDDERNRWVKALYNAGQLTRGLLLQNLSVNTRDVPQKASLLPSNDGKSSPVSLHSSSSHFPEENVLRVVMSIEGSNNNICADCSSTESVEWISSNFLVTVCLKCSSCHRNMGSHISRVRSLKLDHFKAECRVLLDFINNAQANEYLEEKISNQKIAPTASDEARLTFIKQKYEQRSWVKPIPDINSLLVRAVQKITIPEIVKLLNCGADPNTHLQMNNPGGGESITVSLFEYSLRKQVQIEVDGVERKFFVVSELLLLHGCNIQNLDSLNPDVVDDPEAHVYWIGKIEKSS